MTTMNFVCDDLNATFEFSYSGETFQWWIIFDFDYDPILQSERRSQLHKLLNNRNLNFNVKFAMWTLRIPHIVYGFYRDFCEYARLKCALFYWMDAVKRQWPLIFSLTFSSSNLWHVIMLLTRYTRAHLSPNPSIFVRPTPIRVHCFIRVEIC